jgi:hypothetical protein
MRTKWIEVLTLRFEGDRFADNAIDIDTFAGLTKLQGLLSELARHAWKEQHPDRARAPRGFEGQLRLCIRQIRKGSVALPLLLRAPEADTQDLFEDVDTVLHQAAGIMSETLHAAEKGGRLPDRFPRSLVPSLIDWADLRDDTEVIRIDVPRRKTVKYTLSIRNRLEGMVSQPRQEAVQLSGEVFEADVRVGRFQIALPDATKVTAEFEPGQEEIVTSALKEHKVRKVAIKGTGQYSPAGMLSKVVAITELRLESVPSQTPRAQLSELWRDLDRLSSEVPDEEWRKLPTDLSLNVDHYLYGHKKK